MRWDDDDLEDARAEDRYQARMRTTCINCGQPLTAMWACPEHRAADASDFDTTTEDDTDD